MVGHTVRREWAPHPLTISYWPTRQLEALIIQPRNSRRFILVAGITVHDDNEASREPSLLQIQIVLTSVPSDISIVKAGPEPVFL